MPRNALSAALLLRQILPSSRKRAKSAQRLSMSFMGFRTSDERERVSRSRSSQACMSSKSGLLVS
ncbi:hypothetical protein AOQ72_12175 [Bradyrhizobium yuanmingense]|uniref:Uncharacterized protein n=1 Tax=Bradyrhizobium yuanmingense TaxID=108015 RepID=A0A0R3CQ63_9BRAD|nr:hypothetical protein AOQ72_12175 [Bradyrhizobium yuanmingense]